MAAETEVTLSASGATSVTLWTIKLDHNLDKPIINIPLPRQKSAMDAGDSTTSYLIDIGRVKEIITIQAILIDETTEAAQEKKDNILLLVKNYRAVTLTWGTGSRAQTVNGNINKVMITEGPGIVGTQKSGYESEKKFDIQLSFMIGTDK